MKKFILINFFFAVATSLFAYTVIVDNNGVLKAPKASEFKSANGILSIGGYQINIDTAPNVNAFDAEETHTFEDLIFVNSDPNMGASVSGGYTGVSKTSGAWTSSDGSGYGTKYIANADLTNDTEAASLGIEYAIDYTTYYTIAVGATSGSLRINYFDLKEYGGQTVKIKISFYAKKISDDTNPITIWTNGLTANNRVVIKNFARSLFNFQTWTKVEEVVDFTVIGSDLSKPIAVGCMGGDTGSYRIANFNMSIVQDKEYSVSKTTEWTDGEFKVLDASGNLIYWVSTQWGAQMGGEYESNPATDLNAKIFYTSPENENNGAGKGREWIEYVHNNTNARTIYEHAKLITGSANPIISGIVIQPDWSNGDVKSAFKNGKSFIYLKCSPTSIEKTKDGLPVWRTVVPQPIQ
ncbi:MAG: hypothetical protein J6R08_07975 [Opitutales bacterium]|nr:hypothetical protein [Opitutales bacterium]